MLYNLTLQADTRHEKTFSFISACNKKNGKAVWRTASMVAHQAPALACGESRRAADDGRAWVTVRPLALSQRPDKLLRGHYWGQFGWICYRAKAVHRRHSLSYNTNKLWLQERDQETAKETRNKRALQACSSRHERATEKAKRARVEVIDLAR